MKKEIRVYRTAEGKKPFSVWVNSLRDFRAQTKIYTRIERAGDGNMGNVRSVGKGVKEMKIDYGPGYRLYCWEHGNTLLLLLSGGDKSSQKKDIKKAIEYLEDYKNRLL